MNVNDEIPLEDHRYFHARLEHLQSQNPAALLIHLKCRTLTQHLREVTGRAMQAKAELVINHNLPVDQADEMVMHQIVADPRERSRVDDVLERLKLRSLLDEYRSHLARIPRTYQSQTETIE